jgi:hypothetical protein
MVGASEISGALAGCSCFVVLVACPGSAGLLRMESVLVLRLMEDEEDPSKSYPQ